MKEQRKTPKLRFPGFTDDWEQRKLGEFGKATGGTSIESEFVEKGNYKVISIGSYSEMSKYNDQGLRTNKTPKTESKILNKDDLTMILNDKTAAGNIIGRVLLIDADNSYVYNQRTERIEVYKEDFEPSFLYQLLNAENIRSKIIKASQGNTQIYVNWSSISELEYLIPKVKSEQKKIATILNNLDNLITLHQRKCDAIKELKKGMLQKMFPKNGEKIPEVRFPGFTDDWEQRKWIDVVDISTEMVNPTTGAYDNMPHIAPGNIESFTGRILDNVKTVKEEQLISGKFRFRPDDVVYGKINPQLGKYFYATVNGLTSADAYVFNGKNGLNQKFLFSLIQTSDFFNYSVSVSKRSGMPKINRDELNAYSFYMPSEEEQEKIGSSLLQLDNLITLHQRKVEKLKEMKKGLLQQMFV